MDKGPAENLVVHREKKEKLENCIIKNGLSDKGLENKENVTTNTKDCGNSQNTVTTQPITECTMPKIDNEKTDPINGSSINDGESKDDSKLGLEKTSVGDVRPKPLAQYDFFKTYQKKLADMTRDDLEEFCILKIGESIIDRSEINEIRSKLKTMSEAVEEYKRRVAKLTKQNRDLQVVLKSIQEELKISGNQTVTPLKIMRSVGMQVLIPGKSRRRAQAHTSFNTSNSIVQDDDAMNNINIYNRQTRKINTSPRGTPQKQAKSQQIPVPRLVPAAQNTNNRNLAGPLPTKTNVNKITNFSTGKLMSPPLQGPVKRSRSNVPSDITVDLTDDEPALKLPAKNSPTPPVQLVSTHNLLAQRPPIREAVNSPIKASVSMNLNGLPGQKIRPGQTRQASLKGPRPRTPLPQLRPEQNSATMKRVSGSRHPAPLPDTVKQHQPPNWKALPPPPDLKLSKVESGIVVSWKIEGYQEDSYEEIASYQLYAYQENSAPPSTSLWKKIGDVKALPLPMACTLTQFMAGYRYYFAVRAVDIRSRLGPFSLPGTIHLFNKCKLKANA